MRCRPATGTSSPSSTSFHFEHLKHHVVSGFPRNAVHVLQVSAQVATLGERLLAVLALEGSEAGMLPEVIAQIAAFLEHAATAWVFALKVELDSLGIGIFDTYRLVPLLRDPLESLVLVPARVAYFF